MPPHQVVLGSDFVGGRSVCLKGLELLEILSHGLLL